MAKQQLSYGRKNAAMLIGRGKECIAFTLHVDKYDAKHKTRMKKLEKERSEREAKAAKEAKAEKVKAMGKMMHSTLAVQRLAKWNPTEEYGNYIITLGTFKIKVGVPEDAPIDIWDKIVTQIEETEAKLSKL